MVEELDPAKYHIMSSKQQKLLTVILIFFSFIIVPIVAFVYYKAAVHRPAQMDREITFEIAEGQGLNQISANLYKEGVLNSQLLFKVFLVSNKLDKNIEAGVYTVPAGSSIVQLAAIFQHGTNDVAVTFIEGWRTEEIAFHANSRLPEVAYESFVHLAKPNEGYLFPDTYFLEAKIDEQELVNLMRKTFDEKTSDILTPEKLATVGLTREEAVIFASIVEREVNTEEDRPIVAGILIKRWKNGELIGADATTQYAVAQLRFGCNPLSSTVCPSDDEASDIDWWPEILTLEDLDFENSYNTRKMVGLPPSPIANPGLGALNAVVNPANTSYYYYLTDTDGVTHYAQTLDEHNQNIATYL